MVYNTFGWDTVYVIDVNLVNAALRSEKLPALKYDSDGTEMTGTMGSTQIVSGGSGKLLRMSFQITKGSLASKAVGNASLDGVALIADLELTLLPSRVPTSQNLVPDIRSVSPQTSDLRPLRFRHDRRATQRWWTRPMPSACAFESPFFRLPFVGRPNHAAFNLHHRNR